MKNDTVDIELQADEIPDAIRERLTSLMDVAMSLADADDEKSDIVEQVYGELLLWWKRVDKTSYDFYIDEYTRPHLNEMSADEVEEDFWFRNVNWHRK